MNLPELKLLRDITDLQPSDLTHRRVALLGIDIENVLTDYKDTAVRPETVDHLTRVLAKAPATQIALITNKTDHVFVGEVSDQLGKAPTFAPTKSGSLRGKTTPDLFRLAAREFNIFRQDTGAPQVTAAHLDDQIKNFVGMARVPNAVWRTYFWTQPYGERQHPGVRAFRPLERLWWNRLSRSRAAVPIITRES